jgi:hypothetical protein
LFERAAKLFKWPVLAKPALAVMMREFFIVTSHDVFSTIQSP